jgi:hypothetical protein
MIFVYVVVMNNNIIAIVVICFITVGTLWGIGNIMNPPKSQKITSVDGILLIANRNTFNDTNPTIRVSVNVPEKLVVRNSDIVTHDLKVDRDSSNGITAIDTAPLRGGQDFPTAIVAEKAGTYVYYCSFHPPMRGIIVAK